MAVHVDNAMSEVEPEVEPSGGAGGGESAPWEEEERVSAALSRTAMERSRTAAEGFDD
jgi:hypothetical protein